MTDFELAQHLILRGADPRKYRMSATDDVAVFPLWNFGGQLKGYQQYRPFAPKQSNNPKEARYFTRSFEPCLWGLEYLPSGGTVFVTESIFKACAIHKAGFQAVACLGSNIPAQLRQQMLLTRYHRVCAGDDDAAGVKFSRTFTDGFVSQDLDELTTDAVYALASKYKRGE